MWLTTGTWRGRNAKSPCFSTTEVKSTGNASLIWQGTAPGAPGRFDIGCTEGP